MQYVIISNTTEAQKTAEAYKILDAAFAKIRKMGGVVTVHSPLIRGCDVVASDLVPKFGDLSMGETRAIHRRLAESNELT